MILIDSNIVKDLALTLTDKTVGNSFLHGLPIYETQVKDIFLTAYDVCGHGDSKADLSDRNMMVLFTPTGLTPYYHLYISADLLLFKKEFYSIVDECFGFVNSKV